METVSIHGRVFVGARIQSTRETLVKVQVEGVAPDGKPIDVDLTGWPARIAQHEMDHLNETFSTG